MIVVKMEKAFRISLIINIAIFILFVTMTILFITKKSVEECPKEMDYGLKNIVIDEANIPFRNDQYTYDIYLEDETVDRLNIKAMPYNADANISISGNHGLAGANKKITITVTDINDEVYEYIVNVNKTCENLNNNNTDTTENN